MYKLYVEDILLFIGTLAECDDYISKNMCTGYYLIKVKGDDNMKQVMNFWKLDLAGEDKFESLVVLGYLTFKDNGTQSTIYYDLNNNDLEERFVKNGSKTLCGDYFYGTREQYLHFLNNEF